MLNEMRFGRLTPRSIAKFKSLSRAIQYEDGLDATELYANGSPSASQTLTAHIYRFPRREDVERSNLSRINRLCSKEETFNAYDGGLIVDETQRQKMLANFMAPQRLSLRVDAQVMLIKNVDETLVNGSIGRVVRFVDPAIYGTDLDIEDASGESIGSGPPVGTAAKKAPSAGLVKLYPVVEFLSSTGGKRSCLVLPETWKVELPNGEVQVSRSQVGRLLVVFSIYLRIV
jgi:ATP-dependent DNA helicase PIF1